MTTMRERILEKASELFNKYGIKRITMDEIAAGIGISKKTIYLSFADKNELVSEIFNKHISCSQQDCAADSDKAENAIHEVFLGSETFCNTMKAINPSVLYDLEKYHPDVFKKFVEFKNKFIYARIFQNLKRGMEEELYRKDMNPDVLARMRLANILLPANIELFPGHQFNFSDVERELITHFLYGIVTPKGAKMMKKYAGQISATQYALN